jgi:ABC-type microcin C transport system permease subunit YejB
MSAYIIRRLLFIIPTMFGIMLVAFVVVQFAPGGPVEQVIAKLTGADTGATSRISGSPGGDFGSRGLARALRRSTPPARNIAARKGSILSSSRNLKSNSASTSPHTSDLG